MCVSAEEVCDVMFTIESILADRRKTSVKPHPRPPENCRGENVADGANAVTAHGTAVDVVRERTISPPRETTAPEDGPFGSRAQQPRAAGGRKRSLSDGEEDISGLFLSAIFVCIHPQSSPLNLIMTKKYFRMTAIIVLAYNFST